MTADLTTKKPTPNLAFISQHLFTAILWVSDELVITWLNAQAEQLLAISSGRLLNQSILTLLASEKLKRDERTALTLDNDNNNTDRDKPDNHCALTERFHQAKQYQQPFIDHDRSIRRASLLQLLMQNPSQGQHGLRIFLNTMTTCDDGF